MELKIDFVSLIILVERSGFVDKFTFGNRLYELRTQNNLTQKQLAKYLGVSNKAVSKWETGEAMPRVKTLQAIAQCFGITYSDLLSETPSEEKLPPYEVFYRNKIEAKEDKFVKDSKTNRVFIVLLIFVKILFCLFNAIFIKINVLYSVFSMVILMLSGVFYFKFSVSLTKNIKSVTDKDYNKQFCYLLVPVLHAVIDSIAFYKYDFNNKDTIALHILSLVFLLLFHIIRKKVCSEEVIQFVAIIGICLPLLLLGMWVIKGTGTMYNYIENLMLLNEKFDNAKIYDVFVGCFILFFNIVSMAIYGQITIDYFSLTDIIRVKQIKNKDNEASNEKTVKILTFVALVGVAAVVAWVFSLLFKFLDLI